MLVILGLLAVVLVTLAVVLWAGTTWMQGYFYENATADLIWRAPAAAAGVTLFLGLWCYLDYRTPGQYPGQFYFTTSEEKRYDKFWSAKDGKETLFKKRTNTRGQIEYYDETNPKAPWSTSEAIVVEEDGERVRFEPERDANGNYKRESGQPLHYLDSRGRAMTEEQPGVVTVSRKGALFGNLLLNAAHLVVWFVCVWLLLRFQWSHALGLGIVLWVATTLFVLPPLLGQVAELPAPA